MTNGTMLQYFEWYLPADKLLWQRCAAQAASLEDFGVTSVWLPPAYKGANGERDVGYAVYDMYDLGEFNQKDSIPTKYGTKEEYITAIKAIQAEGIQVLGDIVFNHKMGADETEDVEAFMDEPNNRNQQIQDKQKISAWTKFTFPGRNNMYSNFQWNWTHFKGIDWDNAKGQAGIYRFEGKAWSSVDPEKGNYDYLMGVDVDMDNPEVVEELKNWGKWYLETTNVDGFRLDAVKHIRFSFFGEWLDELRRHSNKELFTVGEYWSSDIERLKTYLDACHWSMSLFDVPLHMNFYEASQNAGNYDMSKLLENTLVQLAPQNTVTFVDNHDSQNGQALFSFVAEWFKPLAYAIILLRKSGYPCLFYGDYYGIPHDKLAPVHGLLILIKARLLFAYGEEHDYFDDFNIVGWTREGDAEHENSGMAILLSDSAGGEKRMYIGTQFAGQIFRDCFRRDESEVYIEDDGWANFHVEGGSVSVWVPEEAYRRLAIEAP